MTGVNSLSKPAFALSLASAAALLLTSTGLVYAEDAKPSIVEYVKKTLADNYFAWMPNGVIIGKHGVNKGKLIIASVITNSIRVVDPDTGKLLRQWAGEENGLLGADDMTEGPDGTIYHVNADGPGLGFIKPDGTIGELAKDDFEGGWTNSISISHDGKTLFFAQAIGEDAVYTLDLSDPDAKAVKHAENVGWHNSTDYSGIDGKFYGGNNVYGGIMQFDPETGEDKLVYQDGMEFVSSAEVNDATGLVYATEFHLGHVNEIDLKNNTRRVIATTPPFLDNVAVEDKLNPRIFVASYAYDAMYEVYRNGEDPRIIMQGDGSIPEGIVVLKGQDSERILIRDRFRLREYFPQTGTYKALAHATFDSFIEDRPFYDTDRVNWTDSVKDYVNLRWMRSLHAVGSDKVIMAGGITDNQPGRIMLYDLVENKPIRVEKGWKTTTADAIVVGEDIYVANGDVITRLDPAGNREDVFTGMAPSNFAQSDEGAWVSDLEAGTIHQVADGEAWLSEPRTITSDLNRPHGMSLANDGNLLVIEEQSSANGTGRLLKIDLQSGAQTIIADSLEISFTSKLLTPLAQVAQTADGTIYVTEPGAGRFSILRPRT